jgi:hypothetical protein
MTLTRRARRVTYARAILDALLLCGVFKRSWVQVEREIFVIGPLSRLSSKFREVLTKAPGSGSRIR